MSGRRPALGEAERAKRRWQLVGWVLILIMARSFFGWLGWLMSTYRELFARQIEELLTYACIHLSTHLLYY